MGIPCHALQSPRPGDEVVIVGAGEQGEIAYEYLSYDSPHTVVGFAVERAFLDGDRFRGLPLFALEEVAERFPPDRYRVLVAVSSTRLNQVRARLFRVVKDQGFTCVSYVSTRAFVWHNVEIGENVFVFEGSVLQHRVDIGDNVIIWSGAHVAHQTMIEPDCFLAPQSAVAGFCRLGRGSFLGVNCCVADGLTIAPECLIGAGAVVIRDTHPRSVNVGNPARPTGRDSFAVSGVFGI
jgi:sugar O-acyltransferase (sialic acid O-acetyltransferase NeuD family)